MRFLEESYRTPPGFQDRPFFYVYDATGHTDGLAQLLNISKALQGDSDFILRSIMGVPTVVGTGANGGRFRLKNSSGSYAMSAQIVTPNNYSIVPEKLYKYNESIQFDLYQTLRSFNVCGGTPIYDSFIAFQGVKRFPQGHGYPMERTPYAYREVPYAYEYDLTINWGHFTGAGLLEPPRRFSVLMEQYDFELQRISIAQPGARAAGALTTDDFQIMLHDANMHQLSDLALNQGYVNAGRATAATAPPYQAQFPTPPLVYPAGGSITFDVTSMLCAAQAPPNQVYNLLFAGVWRIPCNSPVGAAGVRGAI